MDNGAVIANYTEVKGLLKERGQVMDGSWKRIPAEYVVANVKLCHQGKLGKRKGFLHVRKGRIEALGVGSLTLEGLPILDAEGLVCTPGFVVAGSLSRTSVV